MGSAYVKFQIKGLDKLLHQLEEVSSKAPAICRKAIKEASKPVVEAAKALAPKRYGALRKSIGDKQITYEGSGITVGVIGPRNNYSEVRDGKRIVPALYAHLVEYGTAPHRLFGGTINASTKVQRERRRDVLLAAAKAEGRETHPGSKAQPFMRPAWDANVGQLVPTMSRVISEEIAKEVAKNGGR